MGVGNLFRRRNQADGSDAIGLGDDQGDLEPGVGGPSFFRKELAELRWAAQNEALNVARSGIEPTRWVDGRLSFDYERGLAHGHSALRDRLANVIGDRIRTECRELYSLASAVGDERAELANVDKQLVTTLKDWGVKHKSVFDNELDLNRYLRLKFINSNVIKYLVASIFVLCEFFISGRVFGYVFPALPGGVEYLLAFGVTIALIVIPHYSALGLKEGFTKHHKFEKEKLEKLGKDVPAEKERAVHVEEKDDNGFRWASIIVGAGLLILIIPLTIIRAEAEAAEGVEFDWWVFLFLLLLQYCLSGYFFLREWLDHGQPSHSLHMADQEKKRVERLRSQALSRLGGAAADFHDAAEDLIFTVTQAPRWDNYIVSSYYETIRYCRHLIRIENPEYEQFITWASVPYLGTMDSASRSTFPVEPLSNEHMLLEEDGLLGREWWLRATSSALTSVAVEAEGGAAAPPVMDEDVSWLVTKSPDQLLETFLARYYGLPLVYEIPDELKSLGQGEPVPEQELQAPSPPSFNDHLRQLFGDSPVESDSTPTPAVAPAPSDHT